MADELYGSGRNAFLTGQIDWTTASISIALVDTSSYTMSAANDNYFSDIPSAAVIATTTLSNKTASAGVADADDPTFPTVASGSTGGALVIYQDTGTASTSQLIAYIDSATGLPIQTSGGNIIVQFSSGTNRIFKL